MGGVEYQVTKVDPTDPETKGMVYQVHKVTEEVAATLGGKVYRARIIKDPSDPAVAGKVYQIVLIGDPDDPAVKGKVYNAILTGGSEAVVVGPAVSPLALPDAIADSLVYVKAFGGTEQSGTPAPDAPMDIVSNNGVLKLLMSATGTGTQSGTPTPTNPIYPVFYKQGDMILRCVGDYADSYDATTKKITRRVGVKVFDGTENFNSSSVGWAYGISDKIRSKVLVYCTHYAYSSATMANAPDKSIITFSSQNIGFKDSAFTSGADVSAFCLQQYNASTPVTVYYPLETPVEEDWTTPIIYTDGTVETIEDTIGNTATAEMLLKVGDYQDVQSIIDGVVTRNVGVLVLDGTEEIWGTVSQTPDKVSVLSNCYTVAIPLGDAPIDKRRVYCTHLNSSDTLPDAGARQGYALLGNGTTSTPAPLSNKYAVGLGLTTRFPTIAGLKQWLAQQYNAGTPVIVVYPLAEPITESVAGQPLQVTDGDNTLEITQASLTGLELEAEYEKEAE